jgi:hypothetical protein
MIASRRMRYPVLAIVPLVLLVACGSGDDTAADDAAAADSAAMLDQIAAGMAQAMQGTGASDGPRLSTEQLQAKIPETVIGLQRTEISTTAMGAMSSTAARYAGDDDRTVEITFVDAGAGAAGMAMGWTMTSFNRTTPEGFERTTELDGLKAYESEDRANGTVDSEINLLTGNYLVQLRGGAVDLATLRGIAEDLELRELAP